MKMNDEINREIMFHKEAVVEIRSADDSSEKQISDINYFVKNGFDIIIVSPNEAETLTPIIEDVYKRGIPVVIFDRNINSDSYTARIGVDDKGLGQSAAPLCAALAREPGKSHRDIRLEGVYSGRRPARRLCQGVCGVGWNLVGQRLRQLEQGRCDTRCRLFIEDLSRCRPHLCP